MDKWNHSESTTEEEGKDEDKPKEKLDFFVHGAVGHTDLNLIIYKGAPTSTWGQINSTDLCDALCITLHVEKPHTTYLH